MAPPKFRGYGLTGFRVFGYYQYRLLPVPRPDASEMPPLNVGGGPQKPLQNKGP